MLYGTCPALWQQIFKYELRRSWKQQRCSFRDEASKYLGYRVNDYCLVNANNNRTLQATIRNRQSFFIMRRQPLANIVTNEVIGGRPLQVMLGVQDGGISSSTEFIQTEYQGLSPWRDLYCYEL